MQIELSQQIADAIMSVRQWLKPDPLTVNETFTLIIALYAAVLSTYKVLADRRRIKVRRELLPIIEEGKDPIELKAVNVGKRPVTLEMLYAWRANDNSRILPIAEEEERKFPKKVSDGESLTIYLDLKDIGECLAVAGLSGKVILRPYFVDDAGKKYWGDKLVVEAKARARTG